VPRQLTPDEVRARILGLGFSKRDTALLADHFLDAERRGKLGHGLARVEWLAGLPDLDPTARPECVVEQPGFERWDGRGALGYLTLGAICDQLVAHPPRPAKVVVAANCFPTGMLGYWVRRLAEAGLASLLTATSPPRLPHPDGGQPLVGTIPLAIGIPSAQSEPIVADVSMAKSTHGDVLAGRATAADLVPFGGPQAHKSFALALGLQLLVQAAAGAEGYGAFLVAFAPESDPVPELRAVAAGLRLPGDR
jgi:ureidoglycolate dehydrogenase (NAD+)